MNTDQLQIRLDQLERRHVWMLRVGSALGILVAAASLMAQTRPVPPGTQALPIKASSVALVDGDGQTRAVLRMERGAPVLQFQDASGAAALRLTVRGTEGWIEYVDRGEVLNLMKPAPRVNPLTTR